MTARVKFSSPINKYFKATAVTMGMTARGPAGGLERQAQGSDVYIEKHGDALTPALMTNMMKGTIFATVVVEYYRNDSGALFLTYTFTDVIITSFQTNRGDQRPIDLMTINAGKMSSNYFGKSDF